MEASVIIKCEAHLRVNTELSATLPLLELSDSPSTRKAWAYVIPFELFSLSLILSITQPRNLFCILLHIIFLKHLLHKTPERLNNILELPMAFKIEYKFLFTKYVSCRSYQIPFLSFRDHLL